MPAKSLLRAVLAALCILLASMPSLAVVINVDFGLISNDPDPANNQNYIGLAAAPDAGTRWNHVLMDFPITSDMGDVGEFGRVTADVTATNLLDSHGNATSTWVKVVAGDNTGFFGTGAASPKIGNIATDAQGLMREYLIAMNNSTQRVTIGGLTPGSKWNLYLYGAGDGSARKTTFSVTDAGGTQTISTAGVPGGAHTLAKPTDWRALGALVSDAQGTITVDYRAKDNPEGVFNGFQLAEFTGEYPNDTVDPLPVLYAEAYRPRFHFTSAQNWLNDPNGLVWNNGTYHLFFQHNPSGNQWGNMTWGHAVSADLMQWKQLDNAIVPDANGTIFSGSAVIDKNNMAGYGAGAIVAMFTYAGDPFTQGIAYSTDGRTFTKHPFPVIGCYGDGNRDPKVFWHEPSGAWRMALYQGPRGKFALFGSPDLKHWTKLSEVDFPDGFECPELFEIAVTGNPAQRRWIFWEGDGRYMIGQFDGTSFVPDSGVLASEWGANSYAGQTYNNMPDGRRVLITWMRGGSYPDMPFNQQMSIPRELTLHDTPDGLRLFQMPVAEVEKWRQRRRQWSNESLSPGANLLDGLEGELIDLDLDLQLADADVIDLVLRGNTIRYDVASQTLSAFGKSASVVPLEGDRLRLRVLLDITSIEIFANDGRTTMSFTFVPDLNNKSLSLRATGGTAHVIKLDVYQLRSVYNQIPGDADADGDVDEDDARQLALHWGQPGGWPEGDFNGDGRIGPADAAILAAHWGQGAADAHNAESTAPEPASATLFLFGLAVLCAVRTTR